MTRYRSTYEIHRPRRGGFLRGLLYSVMAIVVIGVCASVGYAAATWDPQTEGPARSLQQFVSTQQDTAVLNRTLYPDEAQARSVCGEYAVERTSPGGESRGWKCPEDMQPPS